jgi:hypothetical protein
MSVLPQLRGRWAGLDTVTGPDRAKPAAAETIQADELNPAGRLLGRYCGRKLTAIISSLAAWR